MSELIDNAKVFDQSDATKAVFIIYGHHLRFELPFIQYTHDYPEHEWAVCIGVPYGTHIWQVHDTSEIGRAHV